MVFLWCKNAESLNTDWLMEVSAREVVVALVIGSTYRKKE
jgi:hypothetical protein